MNHDDDHSYRNGGWTKSGDEIRALLTSIHEANRPHPSGLFAERVPGRDSQGPRPIAQSMARKPNRDSRYYRRLLLAKSAIAGGFIGSLLGANLGKALPVISGAGHFVLSSILLWITIGCLAGIVIAQSRVIERRVDLFGDVACSFWRIRFGKPAR